MSAVPVPATVPAAPKTRLSKGAERHVVLVANGNASGVNGARERLEHARRALALWGVRVEPHVTESMAELAAEWPEFAERRVVLLGGDGTVHAAANLPRATSSESAGHRRRPTGSAATEDRAVS